jgi:lysophospholipase L1-like esterase
MNKILKSLVLFLLVSATAIAQNKPFWNDIQKFKRQDSLTMPSKKGIVFVGSSSFTMWKDLEKVYKEYNAINRGFGGSTLTDAIAYAEDIVLAYKPRQVVIYSGENDIANGASAEEAFNRYATLFGIIRKGLPKAKITYVSMKQSPSRAKLANEMAKANRLIKTHIEAQKNADFVDVNAKMLDANGAPRPELFLNDMLHMKQAGYDIWIKEITPHLKKK